MSEKKTVKDPRPPKKPPPKEPRKPKGLPPKRLKPLTVDHFRAYTRRLVLDSGDLFEPEDFQLMVMEDVFAGVPEVWMVIPEGNGKTTLMSAVALYHGDYTDDAEVLMAASSRDQCELLFRQAGGFVERTSGLGKRFRVYEGYRRIKCLNTNGRIQVFAADDRTGDGVIPTLALIDELHRHQYGLRLYRTWRGKLDKRAGQLVTISTAGEPDGEFEDTRTRLRQEAIDIRRDGAYTRAESGEVVLHDWAVTSDEDVDDLDAVKAANPFSGVTREILARRRDSPTMTLQHWRRFVCNLPTRVVESAINETEWTAAGRSDEIPPGVPVAVGLDLGWKWDTTGIVPFYMPSRDYRLFGPATVLVPPRDGSSLNPHDVEDAILAIHRRNPISMVAMDTHRAEQLSSWLEERLGCDVIEVGQSAGPMGLAYERFMEGLREGVLFHSRDEVLTRHALNAIAKPIPLGGSRFDRISRSRQDGQEQMRVIDALIAAAMVHSVCLSNKQRPARSRVPVSF